MLFATAAGIRETPIGEAFMERLAVAIVVEAIVVGAEPSTTENYNNRQIWVNRVCQSSNSAFSMAQTMFLAVIMSGAVAAAIAAGQTPQDSDISAVVTSLVDMFAGRI